VRTFASIHTFSQAVQMLPEESITNFKTISITSDGVEETVNECLPKTKLPKNAIRMPHCRQSTSYHCGVSCLQSIMYYVWLNLF
jgi:hypothetical protein